MFERSSEQMLSRRSFVAGLTATVLIPNRARAKAPLLDQLALNAALRRQDSLARAAAKAGMLFGTLLDLKASHDRAYVDLVSRECSLANVWGVAPHTTRTSRSGFDFSFGDQLVALASSNNLAVCGGYLVTHDNVPAWITSDTDSSTALTELQLIVRSTMNHYAGQFDYWIISNEAIDVRSADLNSLRNCAWRSAIGGNVETGTDYVTQAFRTARAADPGATLVYADYGIEDDDAQSSQKRDAVLQLLRGLKRANLIDALGIQGHLSVASAFQPTVFRKFLDSVYGLGLKIVITELDVNDAAAPSNISTRDSEVTQKYARFLDALLSHPGVNSITVWGLSDKYSWLSSRAARSDSLNQRGDLLDANFRRKGAYYAVKEAFLTIDPPR